MTRTDRMGDVVLSTPVLTALKQSFKQCHVAMLVQPYAADVVIGHPDADQIKVDRQTGNNNNILEFCRLVREIRSEKYDAIIVLHPTFRLAALGFLAGIAIRLGTGYRLYSFFFNEKAYLHRKGSDRHELDLNLEMIKKIEANLSAVEFKFHIPQSAHQRAEDILQELGIGPGQPFVVLHPCSGGSAPEWPLDFFAHLATQIIDQLQMPVILTGVENEREQIESVWQLAKKKPFSLVGRLNIKILAALLQRCRVLVANSTGPLHIANAIGTKVVGLYCPRRPFFPERWGPYGQMDSVITPDCANGCTKTSCMQDIPVARVFEMVTRKVSNKS